MPFFFPYKCVFPSSFCLLSIFFPEYIVLIFGRNDPIRAYSAILEAEVLKLTFEADCNVSCNLWGEKDWLSQFTVSKVFISLSREKRGIVCMMCINGLFAYKRKHGWVAPGKIRKGDVVNEKHR